MSNQDSNSLPKGLKNSLNNRLANRMHSLAIHLLRDARKKDLSTGLTPERLSILSILVYTGPKTINQLAAMEQVSAPAITRIVKYLEADRLLKKTKDKKDGRVVYAAATRKSVNLMEKARRIRIERIGQRLTVLSKTEQQALFKIIEKLDMVY